MEKVESKEIKNNVGNKPQGSKKQMASNQHEGIVKKEINNKQKELAKRKTNAQQKEIVKKDKNNIPIRKDKKLSENKKVNNETKERLINQNEKIDREKRIASIKKENVSSNNHGQVAKAKAQENKVHKVQTNKTQAHGQQAHKAQSNKTQAHVEQTHKAQPNKAQAHREQIQKSQPNKNQMRNAQTNHADMNRSVTTTHTAIKKLNNENKKINNYQENKEETNLNDYKNDNKKNKKHKKGLLITLLIVIFLILAITIISTIFGIINKNSDKIIGGVKVNNFDVSHLTREEATQKINDQINNNENNYITLKYNDYIKQIYLDDINGKFDVATAVNDAYNMGRNSDIIKDNYKTIETMINGANIISTFSYDEKLLESKINEISLELPGVVTDASYIIDGNKLIIKNSKDGIQIKRDDFTQNLINSFTNTEKTFELPIEKVKRKEIDIDSIHNEVYKEPKNASYTTNPYKIYKEENGLDFAISIDEAKQMLLENKEEYEIPLKELKPKITVAQLDSGAYPDVLSTFTTTYGTADANRNANIALAAKSITSVVLMPGEVFSYNDLIGECSTRTGYKAATIYLNGKLSTGIGGGICQVSTTLYNAVLRANLEIVERRNHSLGVTYVPAGQDAMVNIGTSDFKFKNNRDYPIKVVAYTGTGSITCQIQGLKNDTEYEVKLESRTIEKTDTRYKVETYKVLYLNGAVVSRTWLSTDTYKYH